jgi:hypothetical protein
MRKDVGSSIFVQKQQKKYTSEFWALKTYWLSFGILSS